LKWMEGLLQLSLSLFLISSFPFVETTMSYL
jgi:hypothetical protein